MSEVNKIARVNWVKCPTCKYRFYIGPQFFMVEGALAICPKCRHEFDPKRYLEAIYRESVLGERWF